LKIKKYFPYIAGIIIVAVVLVVYLSKTILIRSPIPGEKSISVPEENLPPEKSPEPAYPNNNELNKSPEEKLKPAPDFSLRNLNGRVITLSKLKGKVIILDFWSMGCPPCRAEIPHFVNLYKKYEHKGFQMLGVVLDKNRALIKEFAREYNINYPLLVPDEKILIDYGPIIYIPTTFIISANGYIYKKYIGYQPELVFEEDIRLLLRKK